MNFLEERIQKDGVVKEGNVLKVDSYLKKWVKNGKAVLPENRLIR